MTAWHVDERAADAYRDRRLGPIERASVETHAARCAECRTNLSERTELPPALDLDRLWSQVEARVEAPAVGRMGRGLLRAGVRMADLVVLRVIAAQSRQWTISTTLVLAVAAVATVLGPVGSAPLLFLVVAPLMPALGVAATYRLVPHGVDLLESTAPYPPARMLLWRTAYVVATAVPVAVAVGAMVLAEPWAAVAWLLPSAACTLCVAVAATWTDPTRPALGVALAWTSIAAVWAVRDTPWAIAAPSTQVVALVVSLAAALVLRQRLDRLAIPITLPVSGP